MLYGAVLRIAGRLRAIEWHLLIDCGCTLKQSVINQRVVAVGKQLTQQDPSELRLESSRESQWKKLQPLLRVSAVVQERAEKSHQALVRPIANRARALGHLWPHSRSCTRGVPRVSAGAGDGVSGRESTSECVNKPYMRLRRKCAGEGQGQPGKLIVGAIGAKIARN